MRVNRIPALGILTLLFLLAGGAMTLADDAEDTKAIVGKWESQGWLYVYNKDGTFSHNATLGGTKGTWKISDGKLVEKFVAASGDEVEHRFPIHFQGKDEFTKTYGDGTKVKFERKPE